MESKQEISKRPRRDDAAKDRSPGQVTSPKRSPDDPPPPRAPTPAGPVSPANMLALQRAIGNRGVQSLIQARVKIGPADDVYEQEAERVASQVVEAQPETAAPSNDTTLHRHGDDDHEIQASPLATSITSRDSVAESPQPSTDVAQSGFDADSQLERQLQAPSGGSPLPGDTRAFMESRFGTDFSAVRVHTGAEAVQMTRDVGAEAFTYGDDIYMGDGKYRPNTTTGQHLLAHELTHVVQQTGGGVQRRAVQRHFLGALADLGSWLGSYIAALPEFLVDWLGSGSTPETTSETTSSTPESTSSTPESTPSTPESTPSTTPSTTSESTSSTPESTPSTPESTPSTPESTPSTTSTTPSTTPSTTSSTPSTTPSTPPPTPTTTPDEQRTQMNTFDPTGGNIATFITSRVNDVRSISTLFHSVPDQPTFITELAKDLADRAGSPTVETEHVESARREVVEGGGRAFTSIREEIWVLGPLVLNSDLLHEIVHILSGAGGNTALSVLNKPLNEGFTQYFALEVANSMGGVTITPAYPGELAWAQLLIAKYGDAAAYNCYFKGQIDGFLDLMATTYGTYVTSGRLKNNTAIVFGDKQTKTPPNTGVYDATKGKTAIRDKLSTAAIADANNGNRKWLDQRVF